MSSSSGLYAPQAYANTLTPYYKPYNADSGSNWSTYPAVSNVNLAGYDITSTGALDIQASGSIEISTTSASSRIEIAASQNILFVPNSFSGSSAGGINFQDGDVPGTSGVAAFDIIPNLTTDVIRIQAMPKFDTKTGDGSGPALCDITNVGKTIFVSGVSAIELPAAGTVPNGACIDFFLPPAQAAIALPINKTNPTGSPFPIGSTVPPASGEALYIRAYTPNTGTNWGFSQIAMKYA